MRRGIRLPVVVILGGALLIFQGCTSAHKRLATDNGFHGPIKVCLVETAGIMKSTSAETGILAAATIAAPGGSALLLLGDLYSKARGASTQERVPDFGSLVVDKFVGRMREVRPAWPVLSVVPASERDAGDEKDMMIEFKVDRLAYGSLDLTRGGIIFEEGLDRGVVSNGFLSKMTLTMKDPQGEVLWQKSCTYLSRNFERQKSLDELEADEFKLLKEEMEFAAEKTVVCFADDLSDQSSPR